LNTDLLHFLENTYDRKRIFANPNPNSNPNLKPNPNLSPNSKPSTNPKAQ